jgi:hypothetical protein
MKPKETIIQAADTLDKEFYNIPLFGEVHLDHTQKHGPYDMGSLITNARDERMQSINVRAADDGLSGMGICQGDFLTVHLNRRLKNGDIAVIQLGSKVYIRKIFFDKKRIRLETENNTPSPLIIDAGIPGFEILGKVVTVIHEL